MIVQCLVIYNFVGSVVLASNLLHHMGSECVPRFDTFGVEKLGGGHHPNGSLQGVCSFLPQPTISLTPIHPNNWLHPLSIHLQEPHLNRFPSLERMRGLGNVLEISF